MRILSCSLAGGLMIWLAACGGGGGGSSSTPSSGNTVAVSPAAASSATASSGTTVSQPPPSLLPAANTASNAIPVLVSSAVSGTRNFPMVDVTVCTPGTDATANCATIPRVVLDTGSSGLRIFASALPTSTLSTLPKQTLPPTGNTLAECAVFASGYAWGTVRQVDVLLSGEVAQNVPIQVMGDATLAATAPADCQMNIAYSAALILGANGILGVSVNPRDCGTACANGNVAGFYYSCGAAGCTPTSLAVSQQVGNPVQFFPADNNGVLVELPPVAAGGALSASGTLIFGIDTQPNNMLAGQSATILPTNGYGEFNATYLGVTFPSSASFDTGSPSMYLQNTAVPVNSAGFYAPTNTLAQSVTLSGLNSASTTINFNIANASDLLASANYAFNDIAYSIPNLFDLGMPFFFGRHVYFGLANSVSQGGGAGPYVAFLSD
ncbi:DUF3443 family protein [Paraburkholderia dilworthii]|uniref:DUF3443 family protein n=1 Tax=Paraburkholderia dilworthii TaxID=948106 RepID=A0ABW9DK55_9BURK